MAGPVRVAYFTTNFDNADEFAQKVLDETGFRARVDEQGRVYWVVDDDSWKAIQAVHPGFTLIEGEEGSGLPDDIVGFFDDTEATAEARQAFASEAIEDDPAGAADDVTGDAAGIMQGGQVTRIVVPGGKDIWAVTYMADGIEHVYTFDSKDSMIKAFGADWADGGVKVLQEDEVNDGDTWILGAGEAFVGQGDQTYTAYWTDIKEEAALEAGVRDPGLIGEYLSDPDIQRIIAEGEAGGWSEERIQAEIRQTSYYQDVLYPGIDRFLDAGSSDPEGEYMKYMRDVDSALSQLGYERDPDGTYRSIVGDMLDKGISAAGFNQFAPVFKRAEESQDFAAALSAWTERDLGTALTFDTWLDVIDGAELDSEMASIVEKATLQFQAEQQGLEVDQTLIERIGTDTDLHEREMAQAFEEAQAQLLGLGEAGLARYGLTVDDVISASTGIKSASGRSIQEVKRLASKTLQELGSFDDKKIQLYVGFDPNRGTPNRPGLQSIAGEGG